MQKFNKFSFNFTAMTHTLSLRQEASGRPRVPYRNNNQMVVRRMETRALDDAFLLNEALDFNHLAFKIPSG